MDISYDHLRLVSGSGDKSIRMFSMDFGESLKTINAAHEHGVVCCRFLKDTHMFVSSGRDYVVRVWDGDK